LRPSYATALFEVVTTALDSVVHAELPHAVESIAQAASHVTNERKERKKRIKSRTPTDVMGYLPGPSGPAAPANGRRTSIGVPPRF
jgi:hypothetical protein